MNAERECFDPARRSIPAKTSPESVIEVFSFMLLIYYSSSSRFQENAWFVIPVQAFTPRKSLRLYPRGDPRGVTYGQYREAWSLMATGQEGVSGEGFTIENPFRQKKRWRKAASLREADGRVIQRVVIVKFTVMWASVSTACPDL